MPIELPESVAPPLPEWLVAMDARAEDDVEQALNALLLSAGDDEFILGYRSSEWLGVGPMRDEDVAFSAIVQDEIGHARLLYSLLAERVGIMTDVLVYNRPPAGFRNSRLVEQSRTNWAFTLARQYLYDQYEQLLLEALVRSSYGPLAKIAARIIDEEKYHAMNGEIWMRRLNDDEQEERDRRDTALHMVWPLALGMFEDRPGEDLLVDAGILPVSCADLRSAWLDRVSSHLESALIILPSACDPIAGGRMGQHGPDFNLLWDEITSVFRVEQGE